MGEVSWCDFRLPGLERPEGSSGRTFINITIVPGLVCSEYMIKTQIPYVPIFFPSGNRLCVSFYFTMSVWSAEVILLKADCIGLFSRKIVVGY